MLDSSIVFCSVRKKGVFSYKQRYVSFWETRTSRGRTWQKRSNDEVVVVVLFHCMPLSPKEWNSNLYMFLNWHKKICPQTSPSTCNICSKFWTPPAHKHLDTSPFCKTRQLLGLLAPTTPCTCMHMWAHTYTELSAQAQTWAAGRSQPRSCYHRYNSSNMNNGSVTLHRVHFTSPLCQSYEASPPHPFPFACMLTQYLLSCSTCSYKPQCDPS